MDSWRDYKLKNLSDKSCYIAGKIKDCPNFKELFQNGKSEVQKLGLVPISPLDLIESTDYIECMKVDLTVMMRCSNIYILNNYETSNGALMEVIIAKFLNLKIIYQPKEEVIIKKEN